MKTELCTFSGTKIYPGRGTLFVRGDSKVFRFGNGKSRELFHNRKNPRQLAWTQLARRVNKKGQVEEVEKKRTRRAVKSQRGVSGASIEQINQRRNMSAEEREAERQKAIGKAKGKGKAKA